ncbi:hypothetical protein AMECASPLE_023474 [Ameca splendens]|uniref:Uncharacterized protein n=1 Tax=Ameca splendens TaxID=208324 RepID=A0ABV0Z3P9_9TELE
MAVLPGISQTPPNALHTMLHQLACCQTAGNAEAPDYHAAIRVFLISALEIFTSAAVSGPDFCVMAAMGVLSLMRCCVCVSAKWTFTQAQRSPVVLIPDFYRSCQKNSHWPGKGEGDPSLGYFYHSVPSKVD